LAIGGPDKVHVMITQQRYLITSRREAPCSRNSVACS